MDHAKASSHDKTSSHDSGIYFIPDYVMDPSDVSSALKKKAMPDMKALIKLYGGPYQFLQAIMPAAHDRNIFAPKSSG